MKQLLIVAIGLLALGGLIFYTLNQAQSSTSQHQGQKPIVTEDVPEHAPLIGTEWVWLHNELPNGELISTPNREQYILTFAQDGRVQSTTDCNIFIGKFETQGTTISVGPLGSTKKACQGSLESVYAKNLAIVTTYQVMGNRMYLLINNEAGKMVFEVK